jgi:hypothetical protein
VDRKAEFGRRVDAIDQATLQGGGQALIAAVMRLEEQVAELRSRLATGDGTAVAEGLDLLEIRRPVFRVGYLQEKLTRSLKAATLDDSALGRVEFLVIQLVTSPMQGGQLRELVRLLQGRATEHLKLQLRELKTSRSPAAARRATRALSVLANAPHRPAHPVSPIPRVRKRLPTAR